MPNTSNIDVRVTWKGVAELLKHDDHLKTPPFLTSCPACGGRLRVYKDTRNGSDYHHCFDCKSKGDLVKLAQRCLDLEISEVLSMLSGAEGVDVSRDVAGIERIRFREERLQAVWAHAGNVSKYADPECLRIASSLRLSLPTNAGDLQAGLPAKIIRRISTSDVASLTTRSGDTIRRFQVFPGANWRTTLVIPTYTFPGSIKSLIFVGRQGRVMQDVTIMSENRKALPRQRYALNCAGIVCGDLISQCNQDTVIYTDKWLWAVQLQLRHTAKLGTALPIAAWWDYNGFRTGDQLDMFEGRQPIIWSNKLTPAVVKRAVEADAKISICGPKQHLYSPTSKTWLESVGRIGVLKVVRDRARPWQKVVQRWYRKYPGQLPQAIADWEHSRADVEQILIEAKLRRASVKHTSSYYEVSSCIKLVDRPGYGWEKIHKTRGEHRISNASIKITRTYYDPRMDTVFYQGSVRIGSKRAHFLLPDSKVHDGRVFLKILIRLCDVTQTGSLYVAKWAESELYKLAVSLHQPIHLQRDMRDVIKRFEANHDNYTLG